MELLPDNKEMRYLILILSLSIGAGLLFAQVKDGKEEGLASWYAGKFQGRTTASGERFDTNKLTAAHKTLPFHTVVRVTNVESSRSVDVRINDRGPFVEGRIIDLSRAAAEKIGLTGRGVVQVRIEVLSSPKNAAQRGFIIQVGAYSNSKNAFKVKDLLEFHGLPVKLEKTDTGIIRVHVPDISSDDLEGIKSKLKNLGFSSILVKK